MSLEAFRKLMVILWEGLRKGWKGERSRARNLIQLPEDVFDRGDLQEIGGAIWTAGMREYLLRHKVKIEAGSVGGDVIRTSARYAFPEEVILYRGPVLTRHTNTPQKMNDLRRILRDRCQDFLQAAPQFDREKVPDIPSEIDPGLGEFEVRLQVGPVPETIALLKPIDPRTGTPLEEFSLRGAEGITLVGSSRSSAHLVVSGLAPAHFSLEYRGGGFTLSSFQGVVSIRRGGREGSSAPPGGVHPLPRRGPVNRGGSPLRDGDWIVARHGNAEVTFELKMLQPEKAYLEESSFYIVTALDGTYPTIFLGREAPKGPAAERVSLRFILEELSDGPAPACLEYDAQAAGYFLRRLSPNIPVRYNDQELQAPSDKEEGKGERHRVEDGDTSQDPLTLSKGGGPLKDGDRIQVGGTVLRYRELPRNEETTFLLKVLSKTVDESCYYLTRRGVTLSGSEEGKGSIGLGDPDLKERAGIVFRHGGYYLERGGTWQPEPLIPGREYSVGASRIMISRLFLHGRWKARLEVLSLDRRRRFPLSRIWEVPRANCILGDDEAAESANLYYRLEDDDNSPERMSLISDQHLEIRATGPRGLTVTNLSISKPVWLLAGNSEEIERELAPGRSEGERRVPGESSELMRAQRIVLGIHELRYIGPGRTGSVELSAELEGSKGLKVRDPWN